MAGPALPPPCLTAARALYFEHIGPEDASGPPFAVVVGVPGASTETRFLVTAAAMRAICAAILRYGVAQAPGHDEQGTFAVHAGSAVFIVPPAGMRVVLREIRQLYKQARVTAPAMLAIQETLLANTQR